MLEPFAGFDGFPKLTERFDVGNRADIWGLSYYLQQSVNKYYNFLDRAFTESSTVTGNRIEPTE